MAAGSQVKGITLGITLGTGSMPLDQIRNVGALASLFGGSEDASCDILQVESFTAGLLLFRVVGF